MKKVKMVYDDNSNQESVELRMLKIPAGGGVDEFYCSETPITEEQWAAVMGGKAANPNFPKVEVSVGEIERFCVKLRAQTGQQVTLPTDMQFCHALGMEPKDLRNYAVFNRDGICEVKTKLPNEFGLYDMRGLVWEWMADGPDNQKRYIRGGSWYGSQGDARAVFRCFNNPDLRRFNFGFRVVSCVRPPSA